MEQQTLILRHELPRLIEAARTLEASVLVMLLMTVDEELRKQEAERRIGLGGGLTGRS